MTHSVQIIRRQDFKGIIISCEHMPTYSIFPASGTLMNALRDKTLTGIDIISIYNVLYNVEAPYLCEYLISNSQVAYKSNDYRNRFIYVVVTLE